MRTVSVVVVEDNPVDVEAIRRAFARHRIANPIHVAEDGEQALELLRRPATDGGVPEPRVVLADLNVPR